MKLYIASDDREHAILVADEDNNDIAEFFHSDHATVGQSYETALALAKKLVTCDDAQAVPEPSAVQKLASEMKSLGYAEFGDCLSFDAYNLILAALAAQPPAAPVERPKCKLCGLEDGACICAHLPPQRSSAGNVDAAKALELATKLDYARHSRITHGVRVDLDYQEMDLARDALRIAAQPQSLSKTRPTAFLAWARETFGPVAKVRGERLMRFIEEAIELAHADEMERTTLDALANRVYSRPPGEITKEIGQAQACLETYAENIGESSDLLAEIEWQRVQRIPRAEWDRRHKAKQEIGIALTDTSPLTRPQSGGDK